MTKVISVINHKGGVGKTTSSVNIGAGLNLQGKRVLLIDLDPQANLTTHLGLEAGEENNIYTALGGESNFKSIRHQIKKGLDVITSTINLSAAEMELINEPGRDFILKNLIEPIRDEYDFIFIDCPPSLGMLTVNALAASDSIIIAIEPSTLAITGMGKLLMLVDKIRNRINGTLDEGTLLITKMHSVKVLHKDIASELRKNYTNIFKTHIRTNVDLEEAVTFRTDVFEYKPKSAGAEDYLNVCKEIIKKYKK